MTVHQIIVFTQGDHGIAGVWEREDRSIVLHETVWPLNESLFQRIRAAIRWSVGKEAVQPFDSREANAMALLSGYHLIGELDGREIQTSPVVDLYQEGMQIYARTKNTLYEIQMGIMI